MTIPEDNCCDCGSAGQLDGEWKVTCHGWAAMFNALGDHKIIKDGRGHNKALGVVGAYFRVSSYRLPGVAGKYDLALVYDDNRTVDLMTHLSDDEWSGQLYRDGKYKFSFTLERA